MIEITSAKERHVNDFGCLKTYWLFSFADYLNPENIQFGALRVFHDDIVEPRQGVGSHPHKEMEIVTVVLRGEMPLRIGFHVFAPKAGTGATRVASFNSWVSLYWLVSGKTVGGTPLYPDSNRLDRGTALQLYTVGSS